MPNEKSSNVSSLLAETPEQTRRRHLGLDKQASKKKKVKVPPKRKDLLDRKKKKKYNDLLDRGKNTKKQIGGIKGALERSRKRMEGLTK